MKILKGHTYAVAPWADKTHWCKKCKAKNNFKIEEIDEDLTGRYSCKMACGTCEEWDNCPMIMEYPNKDTAHCCATPTDLIPIGKGRKDHFTEILIKHKNKYRTIHLPKEISIASVSWLRALLGKTKINYAKRTNDNKRQTRARQTAHAKTR